MLAARGVVHVLVVSLADGMSGPGDSCEELGAEAITYVRVNSKTQAVNEAPAEAALRGLNLRRVNCEAPNLPALIADYAREHGLEQLFVFRMECLILVQRCLDSFSTRLLDLDELPSRHHRAIATLRPESARANERRAQLASLVLEKQLVPRFNRVFASARAEAEEISRHIFGKAFVLPNIRPLVTKVAPAPPPRLPPGEFLFVGALHYLPNSDGVLWFCREVLPILRRRLGDAARLRVIGIGKAPDLDVVRDLPGVYLSGYQVDLAPYYAQAAAVVVPLRAGTGTRLKILEAFANGRPVVSTTIGAEGLEVIQGEHLLVADSPSDFADACVAVTQQSELAGRLTASAARVCQELYSEEALGRCFDTAMAQEGTFPMDYSS
jgi:polysaccharide biosynthesis protein PslH